MFGIRDFGVFLATGIILNLTPGPDTLYIRLRGSRTLVELLNRTAGALFVFLGVRLAAAK